MADAKNALRGYINTQFLQNIMLKVKTLANQLHFKTFRAALFISKSNYDISGCNPKQMKPRKQKTALLCLGGPGLVSGVIEEIKINTLLQKTSCKFVN